MWWWAFHLDIWSTHDHPVSCRARPLNIEDGLEDTMWIRRLGGERLLATTGCSRIFLSKWSLYYTSHLFVYVVSLSQKNTAHSRTIHVTMGLLPRQMINPRPTRFVSGKAIEYRGRPRRHDVDPSSGWWEVARIDALMNEVFWTTWGDEYKNSLPRTNLTGNMIHV